MTLLKNCFVLLFVLLIMLSCSNESEGITDGTVVVSPTVFNVLFNSRGGSAVDSQLVDSGALVTEPISPERLGYSFGGWYGDTSFSTHWNFSGDSIISDTSLYAQWLKNTTKFTVTFNSNGGSPIDSQIIDSGLTIIEPAVPTKLGFNFRGWFIDPLYEQAWDFNSDFVSSDTTLYAQWEMQSEGDSALEFLCTITSDIYGMKKLFLPLGATGKFVDVSVDWGDGISDSFTVAGVYQHTYAAEDTYKVKVTGSLEHFGFPERGFPTYNVITEVLSFGNLGITSLSRAFVYSKLTNIPQLPSQVTDLSYTFYLSDSVPDISGWNTSNVTNMEGTFMKSFNFNGDISRWNTGSVANMSHMFSEAGRFNQPIGGWNTANVITMESMFRRAGSFNQPIGSWNTSKVTTMSTMFHLATKFNQPIGTWNTGNVTDMSSMFNMARDFNQPIDNWNTEKVTTMKTMFWQAYDFNQALNGWNTGQVTDMSFMFKEAISFNKPLSSWNTSKVTTMEHMFYGATVFNSSLSGWNTINVQNMDNMFMDTEEFNQPIGGWNTSNVTSMIGMFKWTDSFNQPLGNWNVENVTSMVIMFERAKSFNQDLSGWAVSPYCSHSNFDKDATLWQDNYKPIF